MTISRRNFLWLAGLGGAASTLPPTPVTAADTVTDSAGRTVIISSHNPDHAFRFADRVVLMTDGAVVAGAPLEVLTADALSTVCGIPISVAEIADAPGGAGTARHVCLPGGGQAAAADSH